MDRVIEIRTYQLREGAAGQFDRLMSERSLPLLRTAGVNVIAARPSLHAPDTYVLIRAYPSLADRTENQDRFYSSPEWLEGPRDALMACIDTYTTAVIEADRPLIERTGSLTA